MEPVAVVSMGPVAVASMEPGVDRAGRQVSWEISQVSPEASRGAGESQCFLADYKGCCRDARRVSVDGFQGGLAPVFQVGANGAASAADIRPGQTIRLHDIPTKIPNDIPAHTPAPSQPNRIPNATRRLANPPTSSFRNSNPSTSHSAERNPTSRASVNNT